ncbi:MAG: transposase, partial [Cyclobacteriaceae bacterium]|nr:transposase [Cyclobacteriaceae bacterium]
YYEKMLIKHIDLVDRRLLKGEVIPHQEKIFSIFQNYTEFIKKGKLRPNVEIGKKTAITTDQFDLIVDHQIAEHEADNQMTRSIVSRIYSKFSIQSFSVDKGFSSKEDREWLESFIPQVIMPKKGKRTKAETEKEHHPQFRKLKKKHSAIESNINELENRGLGRCPDRSWQKFKNYTALAVCAYNLHKIGRKLLKDRLAKQKKEKERLLRLAA